MKVYTCHKRVEAAKILAVRDINATQVELQCGPTEVYTVGKEYMLISRLEAKNSADLGYYVRYEDGYISWSPTKAFEEGYAEVEDGTSG